MITMTRAMQEKMFSDPVWQLHLCRHYVVQEAKTEEIYKAETLPAPTNHADC